MRVEAGVMYVQQLRYMSMSQKSQVNIWLINLAFFFMDFIINTPLDFLLEHIGPFRSTPEGNNIDNTLI